MLLLLMLLLLQELLLLLRREADLVLPLHVVLLGQLLFCEIGNLVGLGLSREHALEGSLFDEGGLCRSSCLLVQQQELLLLMLLLVLMLQA